MKNAESLKEECSKHSGDMIRTMVMLLVAILLTAVSTGSFGIF